MASAGSRRPSGAPPTLAPELVEAITAPRASDAPRRCFICLTDQEPSDPPSSWVDPCPCTLEAHQDCMQSWVTDCERSNKPLVCPICKATIQLDGPWDPTVALSDALQKKMMRASPTLLLAGLTLSAGVGLQVYGVAAMTAFAGPDTTAQWLLGRLPFRYEPGIDALLTKQRTYRLSLLTFIAPSLVIGHIFPHFGNRISVAAAGLYGVFETLHNDEFLAWPPSPQLALTVFPVARAVYYNFWRKCFMPLEVKLNRQLLGLPAVEDQRNQERQQLRDGNIDDADENDDDGERDAVGGGGGGGILGFLHHVLGALDPDDDDLGHDQALGDIRIVRGLDEDGQDAEVVMEVVIEEVPEGDNDEPTVRVEEIWEDDEVRGDDERLRGEPALAGEVVGGENQENVPPHAMGEAANHDVQQDDGNDQDDNNNNNINGRNHEAPPAPPADRTGLGSLLIAASHSLVNALLFPAISLGAGELLRLTLPRNWTTIAASASASASASTRRPGLLQQQWGRSLLGVCAYVMLKDAVRLYVKQRKVSAMSKRRVRNVDRPRRRN